MKKKGETKSVTLTANDMDATHNSTKHLKYAANIFAVNLLIVAVEKFFHIQIGSLKLPTSL